VIELTMLSALVILFLLAVLVATEPAAERDGRICE